MKSSSAVGERRLLYDPGAEHSGLKQRIKEMLRIRPRCLRFFSPIRNLQPVLEPEEPTATLPINNNSTKMHVKLLEVISNDPVECLEIDGQVIRPEHKLFNDCLLQISNLPMPFKIVLENDKLNKLYGIIGEKEWDQACQTQGIADIPLTTPCHLMPTSEEPVWTNPIYYRSSLRISRQQDGRYIYVEFSKLPANVHAQDYFLEVWVEKHDTRFLQELPLVGNTPLSRKRLFKVPTQIANTCLLGIESKVAAPLTEFFAFALRFVLFRDSKGKDFEGDAVVPLFSPKKVYEIGFGASYFKVPPNTPARIQIQKEAYLKVHLSRQDLIQLDKQEYTRLKEIMQIGDEEKLLMMANILAACPTYDWQFVTALGTFYSTTQQEVDLFVRLTAQLLKCDISHCSDVNTLFRAPNLAVKCMEYLLRNDCQQYLHKVISDYYQEGAERGLNDLITCFVESSIRHAVLIPERIRWLCKEIRSSVAVQFTEPTPIHVTCITSFLYLRLLVPCLLNPHLFLKPEQLIVTKQASRELQELSMQVAKAVQVIANLNGGSNYAKTHPQLNQLILSFFPKICLYVMQVSTTTTTTTATCDLYNNGDGDIPLLHYYFSQHLTSALNGWLKGVLRRGSLMSTASSRSSHSGTREEPIDLIAQEDNQLALQKEAGLMELVQQLVEECHRLDFLIDTKRREIAEEKDMKVTALGKKVPKKLY